MHITMVGRGKGQIASVGNVKAPHTNPFARAQQQQVRRKSSGVGQKSPFMGRRCVI